MDKGKILLKSFGCQMNKLDSSLLVSALQNDGFSFTGSLQDADIVLINTCSVRRHAEERVLSNLGHLKHLKKHRPSLVVAVIGCMAQRSGSELLAHAAVDIVAGPAQIHHIPQLLAHALEQHKKSLAVTEKIRKELPQAESDRLEDFELEHIFNGSDMPGQAFIRAMRGCDNFCTYCIVPYVRGPEVSRPPSAIIEQAKKLADHGIKQITLLGQTINSYCYTSPEHTFTLAELLESISQIDGIKWIRFITSHPSPFDESILYAMADLPKVCPYLHIPAQSGSDTILKAMNRGYTAKQYVALMEKARRIVPGIALAGDFIVGFPGETDDDFERTVNLVKQVRYKNCFIFKYSPRPGTNADKRLADTIPDEIKQKRNAELLELVNLIAEEDNRRFMGQTVEVLVEGLSKKPHLNKADNESNPQLVGRTADDYIVVFNGPAILAGTFVKVLITKTAALTLFGDLYRAENL